MFGMGMGELIVVLVVALLLFGPDRLPDAAKMIGKGIRELRKHSTDLQQTLEQDEQIGSTMRELKDVLRGDYVPEPRSPRRQVEQPPPPATPPAAPGQPAELDKASPPAIDPTVSPYDG